jgi:hypothetical protein
MSSIHDGATPTTKPGRTCVFQSECGSATLVLTGAAGAGEAPDVVPQAASTSVAMRPAARRRMVGRIDRRLKLLEVAPPASGKVAGLAAPGGLHEAASPDVSKVVVRSVKKLLAGGDPVDFSDVVRR